MHSHPPPTHSRINPEDPSTPEVPRCEAAIDTSLVRRFLAGDESAFTEIVNRYRGRIYGLTPNLLRNSADAEEITQDTFIRAYRGLGRFRAIPAVPSSGAWRSMNSVPRDQPTFVVWSIRFTFVLTGIIV